MLALLGPLGALLGTEATSLTNKVKRQAVLWGALALLGGIALVFVLVAINTALTYAVGPVIAPLIIAGVALFAGIVVFATHHMRETREASREVERKRSAELTALVTTAAITAAPVLLPMVRKFAIPAGGLAAATFALVRARSKRTE